MLENIFDTTEHRTHTPKKKRYRNGGIPRLYLFIFLVAIKKSWDNACKNGWYFISLQR